MSGRSEHTVTLHIFSGGAEAAGDGQREVRRKRMIGTRIEIGCEKCKNIGITNV